MGKRTRTAHDHQIRRIDCYNAMTQHLPLKVALYVSLSFIIGYVLIGLWTWGNTNQVIDTVGQVSQMVRTSTPRAFSRTSERSQ